MIDLHDSEQMLGGAKIFQHMDRLAEWQAGDLPFPVTVELDLTNLCNHACPGCTFSHLVNIEKHEIPLHLAERIIDQLAAAGVRAVTFSGGGEPLVYGESRLLPLVERVVAAGMDAALITNGSLLTDPQFLTLCQWIRVSLDGYDAESFKHFHGRSTREFEKVVARLEALGKAKLPGNATLGVGFLTVRESLERRDFWKMAEFCSRLPGIDYLQFRPLVTNMVADPTLTGGYCGFGAEDAQAVADAYQEARAAFARSDFRILLSSDKYRSLAQVGFGRSYDRCLAHFLEAAIGADGKVYVCCHTQGQEKFCLGNLHEQDFATIWRSRRARQALDFNPQATCPPACRLHSQNNLLASISQATHPNFI